MAKRTTIRDVAKKAGVSIATVSFVLNKHSGEAISEKVRKRVIDAADQLDYHPSAAAAGLARKRTRNVALIFYKEPETIANAFYSFVVQGVVKEAIEQDYNLLFSFMERTYAKYADLPKILREKNAEGAIFLRAVSAKLIGDIEARGVPVVTVDEYPLIQGACSLQIDSRAGAKLAALHLVELGHTRIGYVTGASERPSIASRQRGFREALRESGISFSARSNVIECGDLNFFAAYDEAKRVLRKKRRPTALCCANDEVAAGVMRAAHEAGLTVPGDLSVVGFDDIVMSHYTDPPLTTVGVDKERMGRRAVCRLLQRIENGGKLPRGEASTELVPVDLVVRGSTAPPPKSG